MHIGQSTQLGQVQRKATWLMWGCTDTLIPQGKWIWPEGISKSLVWDLSRSEWKSAMLQKNGFLLKYPFIICNGWMLSIENYVSSKKYVLKYENIFSGDTLPRSCNCKGPGWLSLTHSPVQGHALCIESCNRDWPGLGGIQGRKVCQTYICVHMNTLTQTLLQSYCLGLNLPLEPEEPARGCNGVQQENVSHQHEGRTRGIRARPGEGKGRNQ